MATGNIALHTLCLVGIDFEVSVPFMDQYRDASQLPELDFTFELDHATSKDSAGAEQLRQIVGAAATFRGGDGQTITDPALIPFRLHAAMLGQFTIAPTADPAVRAALLDTAAAIVFPYLRELITNLTARTVYPVIRLPPLNIVALRERSQRQAKN